MPNNQEYASLAERCEASWAVVDDWNFPVAQIYSETAKTVEAKVGVGRRWTRLSKSKVLALCKSEAEATKIKERLVSAKAEQSRRVQAARVWFETEKARILARSLQTVEDSRG